jgi:hypothetical protein
MSRHRRLFRKMPMVSSVRSSSSRVNLQRRADEKFCSLSNVSANGVRRLLVCKMKHQE